MKNEPTELGYSEKYSIASMLATSSLDSVVKHLTVKAGGRGVQFAKELDRHYKKRDGFIPRSVLKALK